MTFKPKPNQALLLWKMLTAEDQKFRSPMQSEALPKITSAERKELVRHGFVELIKQKRGASLALTDKAWAWASSETRVKLLQSNSKNGVIVLEGLLHRLIPFLQRRGIALAELFTESSDEPGAMSTAIERQDRATASRTREVSVESQILKVCAELNAQRPNRAIRLAELRAQLPGVPRDAVDTELQQLQFAERIALYRDDNSAAVTPEDTRAALLVGGEPRHLLYWKE